MSDDSQDKQKPDAQPPMEQLDDLQRHGNVLTAKQRFERNSRIAVLLGYDLIDKLRYWEKETGKLSDEQIAERLDPLTAAVQKLREAYLAFSDLEF